MKKALEKVFKNSDVAKVDSGIYIVAGELLFAKSLDALVRGVAKFKQVKDIDALNKIVPRGAVNLYVNNILVSSDVAEGKPRMGHIATYLCEKHTDVELIVIIKKVWGLDVSIVPQFKGWHAVQN